MLDIDLEAPYENCSTCGYWIKAEPDTYSDRLEMGQCHIRAPDGAKAWPVTRKDDWCGEWDQWAPRLQKDGWALAMAVQDDMKPEDVPGEAEVVFVGGTTLWKRRTIHMWCEEFSRVHVGRINTEKWLWACHRAGAESTDGTGWFRGSARQLNGLKRYLERTDAGLSDPGARLPYEEESHKTDRLLDRVEKHITTPSVLPVTREELDDAKVLCSVGHHLKVNWEETLDNLEALIEKKNREARQEEK